MSYFATLLWYPVGAAGVLVATDRVRISVLPMLAGLLLVAFVAQLLVTGAVRPRRMSGRRYDRFVVLSAAIAVVVDVALLSTHVWCWFVLEPVGASARLVFAGGTLFLVFATRADWRFGAARLRALRS